MGFSVVGGDASQSWLIIRNGNTTLGLFQGMFDKNVLTFNPGWDAQCNELSSYADVRELRKSFIAKGIEVASPSPEGESGPGSFTVVDPDGNAILIDQHV